MTALELTMDNVTRKYGSLVALDGFCATLGPGVYGLLGPNGAGKSTLMNMIAGVLRPTEGSILLDGQDIFRLSEGYFRQFGFLPQVSGYYKNFTAQDFLRYIAVLKGFREKAAMDRRVGELLEMVNLQDCAGRKIGGFSGGMKQRLGIAQALLNDPAILVLDEPTAGLDPKERIRLRNLISSFSKNKIVILATHIVSDVESIADEIIFLRKGRKISQASLEESLQAAKGRVWSITGSDALQNRILSEYKVVNIHKAEGGAKIRFLAEHPPEGAAPEEATLEDVYLHYFDEVVQDA